MPRFAANLSLLYPELPFAERFAAAAHDGFQAVEYLFPYAYPAAHLAAWLQDNGLQQVLFNAPPGDWDAGERGIACLPERVAEFRTGFLQALEYAAVLQCPRIHVMAGLAPLNIPPETLMATYQSNLHWAATEAAACGVSVMIEPINGRDMPRFFLQHQAVAHQVVTTIGASNLKVQMDFYHCQIVEGDVASKLRQYLPTGRIGHIQIAGVPERHEPDTGELNYPYLFKLLDALGYTGWVGCEYRPACGAVSGGTRAGLGWLKAALGAGHVPTAS